MTPTSASLLKKWISLSDFCRPQSRLCLHHWYLLRQDLTRWGPYATQHFETTNRLHTSWLTQPNVPPLQPTLTPDIAKMFRRVVYSIMTPLANLCAGNFTNIVQYYIFMVSVSTCRLAWALCSWRPIAPTC